MKFPHHVSHRWIALSLLAIAACHSSNGDGGSSPPPPGEITLDHSTAPAASMVKVDGLEFDACPLRTSEIRIAGQTAPAVLNARHEALMRLPLFYDEGTKWAAPPAGPQDVEIFCNGSLWATLPRAITITELPPAPGTTESMVAEYQQIVADYKALTEALAPTPGIHQQLFTAIFAGLEDVVAGAGPDSLLVRVAELEQTEPHVLALIDAMYAVDDADEAVSALRAHMQDMSTSAALLLGRPPSLSPGTETVQKDGIFDGVGTIALADTELASALSIYDDLSSFSRDFIGQTAETFGTVSGIITIVVKSKLAATISATLSLLDYVLNKLVVSSLPAKLDSIDLKLDKTKLDNSETTSAEFWLYASNVPEPLKISDITSVLTTTLGIAATAGAAGGQSLSWINTWEEIVPNALQSFFGLVDSGMKEYARRNPEGVEYDMETFSIIPDLKFEAPGTTRELYLLWPDHSNIIHPSADQLQWRASDTYWGSAEVSVTPTAMAFGSSGNVRSDSVRVQVGDLAIVLDRYRIVVPEGGSAAFGAKLSNATEEDIAVYVSRSTGDPNISVSSELPLFFDSSNWDQYQEVVLAAAEDDDQEDGRASMSASAVVDHLEGITIEASLTATEEDNDRSRFVINPSSVRVPEGETAEVGVKLSQAPPSKLTAIVTYSSGDRDIVVQSPTVMRFDENNWDSYQKVTLYAEPDEDFEEGKVQFRVSANPPAELDETYITATEDEPGEALTIHFAEWTDGQRVTAEGTLQIELDPDNYDSSLWRGGALTARGVTAAGTWKGKAYLAITNFDPSRPACTCPPHECYERENPEDTILQAKGQILWEPDPWDVLAYHVTILFPLLDGTTFEATCEEGSYGRFYSVELTP
jgi:hypothetical protein